jgi:hypothetical protein
MLAIFNRKNWVPTQGKEDKKEKFDSCSRVSQKILLTGLKT